jgi:predicted ABC-type ATPase
MIARIESLLTRKESFSIETTLAPLSYCKLIKRAQKIGYCVSLVFFWLNSPELAMKRVAERVKNGGHDISESVIRRRYRSGLSNLFKVYLPIVDYWMIADNSVSPSVVVAEGSKQKARKIYNVELFNTIQKNGENE